MNPYQPGRQESDGDRGPTPEFTWKSAAIWMSAAFFWMVLASLVLVSINKDSSQDLVSLGAISAVVFLLAVLFLLARYPAGPRLAHGIGLRPTSHLLPVIGLALGLLCQVPADRIQRTIHHFFPQSEADAEAYRALLRAESPTHAVVLIFVAGLLIPICEELFFRGAVYGALRRSNATPLFAAIVTGVGFTLSHMNLRLLLPIALVAATLALMRALSGSILPSVLAHMSFNSLSMIGATTGMISGEIDGEALPLGIEISLTAVLAVLLGVFVSVAKRSPLAEQSVLAEASVEPEESLEPA